MSSTSSHLGKAVIDGADPVPAQIIIKRETLVERSALPRQDKAWTYTDAAGHFHACDRDGEYPTLDRRSEHRDCDGSCSGVCGGEGYGVSVYSCRICREVIEPGLLHGEHTFTIPGLASWSAKVSAYVPMQQPVSVRFEGSDGVIRFGIAQAVGLTDGLSEATSELEGIGKLGERRG